MKQVTEIYMGAYIYNGAPLDTTSFRAFQRGTTPAPYPELFRVWNVSYRYNSDFLGGAVQDTLSGYQRGNPMGHRLNVTINLNNSIPEYAEQIWRLFNFTASRYDRQFWDVGSGGGSGTTVNFNNTGRPANYFKGLTIEDSAGNQRTIVASSSGQVTTLTSVSSNFNFTNMKIIAKPSHPTIIGVSFDLDDSEIQYFNIANNTFGIERELTIGSQIIQLNLTSVFSNASISPRALI